MKWITDRLSIIADAVGDKRYVLATAIKGALALIGFLLLWWFNYTMTFANQLLAIVALVAVILFWLVVDHALRLKKQIEPKLDIQFLPAAPGYIHETFDINNPDAKILYVAVRPIALD